MAFSQCCTPFLLMTTASRVLTQMGNYHLEKICVEISRGRNDDNCVRSALFGLVFSFRRCSSKQPSPFSGMETWRPQAVKKSGARIPLNPKQYSGSKCGFAVCSSQDSYWRRMWVTELLFPLKMHSTVFLLKQACVKAKYQPSHRRIQWCNPEVSQSAELSWNWTRAEHI